MSTPIPPDQVSRTRGTARWWSASTARTSPSRPCASRPRRPASAGPPLLVLHAYQDPIRSGYHGRALPPVEPLQRRAQEVLEESLRRGLPDDPDVQVAGRVVEGEEHVVLLTAAERSDLLVLGSRGRGGWTGLLLGSVSLRCLTSARGPVAVVRGNATYPSPAPR